MNELARDWYLPSDSALLEEIFPESQESEDEKIRKMLIKFFGNGAFFDSSTNGIPDKDIVAWLEKQGKIVAYYEDRLDECSCKYFNKGYKHALENQGGPKEINID